MMCDIILIISSAFHPYMDPDSFLFDIGSSYSRKEISALLSTNDSNINNGLFKPKDKNFAIIFVTENKSKDRTPYKDMLEGNILEWDGQLKGRTDKLVINHARLGLDLILMYRFSRNERPDHSFVCLGRLAYTNHEGSNPTHFYLRLLDANVLVDPLDDREKLHPLFRMGNEGKRIESVARRFERNRKLRELALKLRGSICELCSFDFEQTYGTIGEGFAEVHHVIPLSEVGEEHETDVMRDLIVLCSNCHSMIHRSKPAMHPDELSKAMDRRSYLI